MHCGAEGSESTMTLKGVICRHVQRVLTTGLSQTFAHVCMTSVALDQVAEHLALVFELDEVPMGFRDGGSLTL